MLYLGPNLTRAPVLERLWLQYLAQHPHLLDTAALTERTEKERRVVAKAIRIRDEVVAASMVMLDAAVDRKIDAPYATADVVIMHSAKKGIVLNVLWQQVR